ncbi:uncharacterized protein LOC131245623 [Magnolia sinica]|uniref:uncharacterized protein LOC131245623 n=1 Tax=Magnolia sinica TaxID=86752 RepID=UPI002658F886|nr:uncharacterized protein LOC131245623 [Magnolia sinica]
MEDHHVNQSPPTTTISSSTSTIIHRIITVLFIAIMSIWANHEASKGFEITITNDATDLPAGRRFGLLFVSDDKATRIIINASHFVENILYPDDHHPRKPIDRVTLRFSGQNLTEEGAIVAVDRRSPREFVVQISSHIMDMAHVEWAMAAAVQQGITRVWLWDGNGSAPVSLLDGMIEYISIVAGFSPSPSDYGGAVLPESDGGCWAGMDRVGVARFLQYGEALRHGFVARLNRAMQGPWHVRMVDDALGWPAQMLCASYHASSALHLSNASDSASASASGQVM